MSGACATRSCLPPSSKDVAIDWKFAQPYSGGRGDRVANSRWPGSGAGFADSAGRLLVPDQMNLDSRNLVDPQHAVIVEIALPHAALIDGDLAIERRRQPEDQAALHFRDDGVGIDCDPGVDCGNDAPHVNLAVCINFDLGDGRDEACETGLY